VDPNWQETSLSVSEKLGRLLKKSQEEMQCILMRNNLIEKKKRKKADLEKVVGMIKGKIEIEFAI